MAFDVIILAAGKGERMNSKIPKVLHRVLGRPMIDYVVRRALSLEPDRVIVVVGEKKEEVMSCLSTYPVLFAFQEEQRGTAHAVLCAEGLVGSDHLLVLYGDTPLIEEGILRDLLEFYWRAPSPVFVITELADPKGYGRVSMEGERIRRIIEESEATGPERDIRVVNTGILMLPRHHLHLLLEIKGENRKGELYITDLPSIAEERGLQVRAFFSKAHESLMGVNTKEELLMANLVMKRRIARRHLENGVILLDENVYIEESVKIGRDTTVYPNTYLLGATEIAEDVQIGPDVTIRDSKIGKGARIERFSFIEGCEIEEGVVVGPFSRIRPKTYLRRGVRIGNFVEVKNSIIEENTKANHLTYIGDAEVGRDVNIGAGTITCNFDGIRKHRTVIEDGAFVGSNVELVAPVRVGKEAIVGAGSTITKDVPEGALAVTRVPQRHIPDYRRRRHVRDSGV
jgi:bifunctional UDP-N-acetylglucosamine pyrophosphorylase/glucosamine-1-phosphate N-acetyltransferase